MEMTAGSLSPEAMFRMAQSLGDDRLTAILSGRDNAVPQFVAQAVLSERQRIRQAQAGQQAQQQMMQQQPSKREELLAQAQNTQGIASVAPDSVANLASGGIVAFSGENGPSEVRAPSRGLNEGYRQALFPERTGYEGMGIFEFLRDIAGKGAKAISGWDERMKRSVMQSGLPTYIPDVSTSDLPSTANSRSQTPAEVASAAATPAAAKPAAATPVRSGGGGEGGGRAAAVGAAPVDVSKYFAPLGTAPSIGPLAAVNRYEKPKSAEEYIAQHKELLRKFGVEENPYAEREAELRAKQAAAGQEQNKADALGIVKMGTDIARARGGVGQALATGISLGIDRKLASDEKFAAAKEKRDEALQAIKIAQNEIKIGHVKTGIAQLESATKNYNDAETKLDDMRARRQEQEASLNMEGFKTAAHHKTVVGQTAAQVDMKRQELAQQLQITQAQLANAIRVAQIHASAAGASAARVPNEIQIMEWIMKDPKNEAAFKQFALAKRPETGPLAGLNLTEPPKGAVREKGK